MKMGGNVEISGNSFANFRLPWGVHIIRAFNRFGPTDPNKQLVGYRTLVLFLTYCAYTTYHISRKPNSVVKTVLVNCTNDHDEKDCFHALFYESKATNCTSFIDILNTDRRKANRYLGLLDLSFLGTYAIFMFLSGFVAERVNLRYFLSFGMVLSGFFTIMIGLGKYLGMHAFAYYMIMQALAGTVQSSGWPAVVTVVANWFGKGKKGLIFGIWNSHTSLGNILGGILSGSFVSYDWGMSFIAPGLVIAAAGLLIWVALPVRPKDVGFDLDELEPSAQNNELDDGRTRVQLFVNTSPQVTGNSIYKAMDDRVRRPTSIDAEEEGFVPVVLASSFETTPLLLGQSSTSSDEDNEDTNEVVEISHVQNQEMRKRENALTFWKAFLIPGVVEFAACLFFAKFVNYTFLYYLPTFIKGSGHEVTSTEGAYYATMYDVGGIAGAIIAGRASDKTNKPAVVCAVLLFLAIPSMLGYNYLGGQVCRFDPAKPGNACYIANLVLLMVTGLLVNGPFALVTTAVSAELGTHESISGSSKALATVTAIIDGTGSLGAAVGPYLAGDSKDVNSVFYMLTAAVFMSLLCLGRMTVRELKDCCHSTRPSSQVPIDED